MIPDVQSLCSSSESSTESPSIGYFAVFDGHGGDQCSDFLHQHLHNYLIKSDAFKHQDYKQSLVDAMRKAEQTLITYACQMDPALSTDINQEPSSSIDQNDASISGLTSLTENGNKASASMSSGSCGVIAVIKEREELLIGNIGDCRAVVSIQGVARAITRDHTAADPEEAQRVQRAGGFVKSKRIFGLLQVTRAFGDPEFKVGPNVPRGTLIATPEIFREMITEEHEFLILACDGLWDVMSNQEAVDHVGRALGHNMVSAQQAAESLVDMAIDRNSNDDITAVVVPFRPFAFDASRIRKPIVFDFSDDSDDEGADES
jgi:serine/threonine protein phosphatase PrpC